MRIRRPHVLVLLAGTTLVALSGCKPAGTGSSSAAPTTTWVSPAFLINSFTTDLATETAANRAYQTAFGTATTDITEQEQKLTLDNNTIQTIGFGQGCDKADASTYPSCVSSEDQTAAYARSDAAAVEAQVQADFRQYASTASTYESALNTFIAQLGGLPFPSADRKYVTTTVTTAKTFQRDVGLQEAELASTPQSSVSAINSQTLIDGGKFVGAIAALQGALGNLGNGAKG
jgi:hypothetical protein